MRIAEEIEKVSAEDIVAAFGAGAISQRAFNLLRAGVANLKDEERESAIAALVKVRLFVRRRDRKYKHESGADRVAASTSKRYDVEELHAVANPRRRAMCERSALLFSRHYCTGIGRNGFLKTRVPASMRKIVHTMQLAVETGVPYHIRMPRGHGKSSYVKCVVMWALATGRSKLVEAVAANAKKAEGIVRDVWNCMSNSPSFIEDFPEISTFIRKCKGNYRRAPFVTYKGENVGMRKTSSSLQLPGIVMDDGTPSKSFNSIMFAVGFNANVRGEVVGDQRPDLMIFDDLQDRDIANNPEQVQEKYELVNGDFMGGDSHTDVSSAFMTSTPIKPDDLSERFAKDPYWRTETFRMMERFPDCFSPNGDEDLWHEFWRLWQHENKVERRDPHPVCNAFYREHRPEMDAGAVVLNSGNFRKNEVSAIEHAMILYFRNPKTFSAEYQMEPQRDEAIYEINEQMILERVRKDSFAGDIPDGTVMLCAATDINPSYALSTAVVAFDCYCTSHIVDYWLTPCSIPGDATDTIFVQKVYDACATVGREIKERGYSSSNDFHWGIDASGNQSKSVLRFGAESHGAVGFPAIPLMGRTDKAFNPRAGTRKYSTRPGVNDTVLCWNKGTRQEYVFFNKDKYEETAQRAWLAEIGSPGGATLFSMRRGYGLASHDELLLQICGEVLRGKSCAADDKFVYDWREVYKHDLGDAVYMCRAIAGYFGLAAGSVYKKEEPEDDGVVFL